jgi:hypothetical protein
MDFSSSSKGSSFNLTFILGNIIYSGGDKSGDYGGEKDCNIFAVQNCQTLALCWRAQYRGTRKRLESRTQLDELVLGMSNDSAIIVDAIRWSFFTKSATATMLTSVRVDFGRQLLSSFSTSLLPSRNRGYNIKTFDRFRNSFP